VAVAAGPSTSRGVPRTLAVIPARLGSTRLPRKPLLLLGGVPLIVRVWERVTSLDVADRCIVATDSDEIAEVARKAGAETAMTRPGHPTGTDRVAEVAAREQGGAYEAILNVQGDEPFVAAGAVLGALELMGSGRFDVTTVSAPASVDALASPNAVKVIAADDGRALYFSRAAIPFLRDDADADSLRGIARQHIGVYAYTPDALARWVSLPEHPLERVERLEQLRALANGISIGVASTSEMPMGGIDTQADLDRANSQWTATSLEGR
jgi:3-deoxy-manno-octulosonate cytidylyltransferase (CMP-KDO synthetase)